MKRSWIHKVMRPLALGKATLSSDKIVANVKLVAIVLQRTGLILLVVGSAYLEKGRRDIRWNFRHNWAALCYRYELVNAICILRLVLESILNIAVQSSYCVKISYSNPSVSFHI